VKGFRINRASKCIQYHSRPEDGFAVARDGPKMPHVGLALTPEATEFEGALSRRGTSVAPSGIAKPLAVSESRMALLTFF
jgi:hypothetical protein